MCGIASFLWTFVQLDRLGIPGGDALCGFPLLRNYCGQVVLLAKCVLWHPGGLHNGWWRGVIWICFCVLSRLHHTGRAPWWSIKLCNILFSSHMVANLGFAASVPCKKKWLLVDRTASFARQVRKTLPGNTVLLRFLRQQRQQSICGGKLDSRQVDLVPEARWWTSVDMLGWPLTARLGPRVAPSACFSHSQFLFGHFDFREPRSCTHVAVRSNVSC